MEDMVEGGDEVELDNVTSSDTSVPPSSSSSSDEFLPLASELDREEDSRESGSSGSSVGHVGSCDPWARVDELPSSLREKMLELKGERCVLWGRSVSWDAWRISCCWHCSCGHDLRCSVVLVSCT